MKKIYIILFIISLIYVACDNREWDNPYDPECELELWSPFNLKASQNNYEDAICLIWDVSSDNFSEYVIERSVNYEDFMIVASIDNTNLEWKDVNVNKGGKIHKYKLYAKANNNESNFVETEITPYFTPELNIEINNITETSATCIVNVNDGGGPINHYGLEWSKDNSFSNIEGSFDNWEDCGESFIYELSLDDNTNYYIRAWAHINHSDKDGGMGYSDIYSFTTPKITHIIWNEDQQLKSSSGYYYSLVEIDNLIIRDNVEVTSYGISQIILKVSDSLILGKNAVIRVRNGYYENAPTNPIIEFNYPSNDEYFLAPNTFGKGGNGGSGVGIGGGGGGYGGGSGGYHEAYGYSGEPNGGDGGNSSISGFVGEGGGRYRLGKDISGNAAGGGGNGGAGANYISTSYGGGGGGYGGGVLVIIANHIVFNEAYPPKFLVSGQKGGADGYQGLNDGENGEGGLLIINCPNYINNPNHYNLEQGTYGEHLTTYDEDNGHGVITGNPTRVFINGAINDSLLQSEFLL
ncbi:MAG: hypothetical protein V2I54_07880 [Bacteroidales bacterium]|jgi:hypothetical protein|nr:hypothetical protein [Bacteroidales bacterium]